MREFLDEYITTLSNPRRERIYNLLNAAKTDKGNLQAVLQKLNNSPRETYGPPSAIDFGGELESGYLESAYNDAMNKLVDLYTVVNNVSLLLNSGAELLTSQIKAIEDSNMAMMKTIENHAFGLVDNGAFDFGFIETFNDNTMRYSGDDIIYSDRSGVPFTEQEQAHVSKAAGILTLSPAIEVAYGMTGRIINSNCSGFITSDTGIQNALNGDVASGWRVAVSSPRPITASLGNVTHQGAQFEIELVMVIPSPCDSIIVNPFADKPFEILKIDVHFSQDGEETSKVSLLSEPKTIDRPTEFGFALNTVSRVVMIVNQPVYDRGKLPARKTEQVYRAMSSEINKNLGLIAEEFNTVVYRSNKKALMKTFQYVLRDQVTSNNMRIFRAELPNINFDPATGPLSIHNFMKNEGASYGKDRIWSGVSTVSNVFKRMLQERVLGQNSNYLSGKGVSNASLSFYGRASKLNSDARYSGTIPESATYGLSANVDAMDIATASSSPNFLDYEYDLGFRNIQIGRGQRVFRGVFVSKSLPAPSDSGEVKIKVDDVNYEAYNSDKHSRTVTSVEYSVTNKSSPKTEADWIPILPTNYSDKIMAERLFYNDNGSMFFRFPAVLQNDIRIYRNGYLVNNEPTVPVEFITSVDNQSIIGVRLPLEAIGPIDIFTADYEVYGDQTVVNFDDRGFGHASIATAYDDNGPGETFLGTQNNMGIQLSNDPYINYALAEAQGSYASYLQVPYPPVLGFLGTYQPITIIMQDGTVAMNQTNYIGRTQNNLQLFNESKTAYIQSGRNIVFNRVIDERFTVYYQYLPSNLKLRTVLRVNDFSYVSPQVNLVQLKSKTRTPDARREL